MYDLLEQQKIFFDRVEINGIEERFSYGNPYIDEDLNLYAIGNGHVFFKIDSCSNLIFANNSNFFFIFLVFFLKNLGFFKNPVFFFLKKMVFIFLVS